jgi:hypothetical protein
MSTIPRCPQRDLRRARCVDEAHGGFGRRLGETGWPKGQYRVPSRPHRPGRGCHDAIVAIHGIARGKLARRLWALDADLQSAFDRLSHDHILASPAGFPARGLVRQWLKAGVVEDGVLSATEEGAPQGGVITPPTKLAT